MPALVLRIPTKRGFTHPPTSTPQAGSDRSEDIFGVHVVCLSIMCVLVFDFEHVRLSGVEPHMTRSEFIRAVNPHFFPPSVAVAVMLSSITHHMIRGLGEMRQSPQVPDR